MMADAAFVKNECAGNSCLNSPPMMKGQNHWSSGLVGKKTVGWLSSSGTLSSSSSSLFSESPSFLPFEERLSGNMDPPIMISSESDSLSDLLSSPERYAFSLNLTLEEVEHQKEVYENASRSLQGRLEKLDTTDNLSPSQVGRQKHEMICDHRLQYGRHPFVCSKCWSYLPVCVCHLAKARRPEEESASWKYPTLQVLVWTHHREWGLTSNTGSILALTLDNHHNHDDDAPNSEDEGAFVDTANSTSPCRLLMKGLPKHDKILQDILDSANANNTPDDFDRPLVVVLWPSSNPENTITLPELREELEATMEPTTINSGSDATNSTETGRRKQVVLLAVDGTWRNARRMVAKLPPHVKRLDLDEQALRWNDKPMDDDNKEEDLVSILVPLRKRGPSGNKNQTALPATTPSRDGDPTNEKRQVCTAEAVVAALHELRAIDSKLAQHVLAVTQTKVDRIRRYRGKVQ